MKHFKDVKSFERRIQKGPNWEDYFNLGGKQFNIYEYGGGSMFHMDHDYVYFLNKRSGDMVYVQYHCPSYQYENGERVQTKQYSFLSMEYIPNAPKWR